MHIPHIHIYICAREQASTLRENPRTYKLACVTGVYGDVTVQLMPKVGAAQWTR